MSYFEYLEKSKGIDLNPEQKEAVSFNRGNALVLSTAGSGKTTVIISRAGRLIYEKLCNNKILTITFSKMAADDMKNRFSRVFDEAFLLKAEFSTIHSFSYKIIRDYLKKSNRELELIPSNYKIVEQILKEQYSKEYISIVNEEEVENVLSKITYAKNMMLNSKELESSSIGIKNFKDIFLKYEEYKRSNKLMDFDDMLHYAYNLLSKNSYYNDWMKSEYDFIQIDEMQDTSKIQHAIIKTISNNNLFMVGDDDQSIYSFRGSFPEYMLNFNQIYKDGKVFYLSSNYRSDANIVKTAKKVIENNKFRYKKAIAAKHESINEVQVIRAKDRALQAKYIVNNLKNYSDKKIGILYRNNISSLMIANALNESKYEFQIKDDKTKFFKSFVLLDILSFIKLSFNVRDRESFSKIYYKSYTYFNKGMCNFVLKHRDESLSVFEILKRMPNLEYYMYERIDSFKRDVLQISKLKPKDIIEFIKNDLEYLTYLEKLDADGRNSLSSTLLILEILDEIAGYCKTIDEFINKIYDLQELLSKSSLNKSANITLSSIHSSKGLEYDIVYMIDNIDKEFPMERKNESLEEYMKTLEEERRVFYVGLTRAKERLNVISPIKPSIFVEEMINKSENHTSPLKNKSRKK